ncbi:hypothetical protein [Stenotrophomonas sp.]|uniref:hypothetical protein n=1 Tax=Stenotrophomonas sp. TaxID=69392 RepID=UPI002897D529|nr:hypothetical protein [Stenotrophomonas sp.]
MYLLLASSFSASASNSDSYTDRYETDAAGNRVVVRTSAAVDSKGVVQYVEQRLDPVDETTFIYDPSIQSEATNRYHEAFCAQHGGVPSLDGETVLSGAVSGWGCRPAQETKDHLVPGSGSDASILSEAPDFVSARAPNGVVAVGNFIAYGYVTAKSSQAGRLATSVAADGGRSRAEPGSTSGALPR